MRSLTCRFDNRDDLRAYLAAEFDYGHDATLSQHVGGRREALRRLAMIAPAAYARTRNDLDGAVTQLSPYLRHRVVTTAEARDAALERVTQPWQAYKFVQELAWHDYFQRTYAAVGEKGVWNDLEPWKTGFGPADYATLMPADISQGETGVDWVDHFVRQLRQEGWLHNHARMWLACYVVHVRRVHWRPGAAWFLEHLVDGDPASNNLSWQWVASTFAAKPYFMNRENVVKFSGNRFPKHSASDPLDASYEVVADRLFRNGPDVTGDAGEGLAIFLKVRESTSAAPPPADAVTWVHDDMLRPDHPAVRPGGFYVVDERRELRSLKPIAFVFECLAELPDVTIVRGDAYGGVVPAVRALAKGRPIVTGASPSSHVRQMIRTLDATVADAEPFIEVDGVIDLKRFSRYWRSAEKALKRSGHL